MFQVNPLLGRGITRKIKPYFLQKIKVKNKMSSAAIFFGALRVKPKLCCVQKDLIAIFYPVQNIYVFSSFTGNLKLQYRLNVCKHLLTS